MNAQEKELKLLPSPAELSFTEGMFAPGANPVLQVKEPNGSLAKIIQQEWDGGTLTSEALSSDACCFVIGEASADALSVPDHEDGYALHITPSGIAAGAKTRRGLLYAWQTIKQIRRTHTEALPCVQITDKPDLALRVYHLDLKGTRRTEENLHAILPLLAEFKINALLVEYEDYVKLERHPILAVPEALSREQVQRWIAAAENYGIEIIPLVQTLGHWQYVLQHPEYAHLCEKEGDVAEGCASQPETWTLVTDFLDEICEMHPNAKRIHIGLDETANIGTCPKCKEWLDGRETRELYVHWLNKVAAYVIGKGVAPMAWGDILTNELDEAVVKQVDKRILLIDWSYQETGPATPRGVGVEGRFISREWLKRPEGEIYDQAPTWMQMTTETPIYEDFPPETRAWIEKDLAVPDFPKRFKTMSGIPKIIEWGFQAMGVSGIRISSHGSIASNFIMGQLNTLRWAEVCKEVGGLGVIGSSWARGHSLAAMNAHPETDWYGIAALGDSCWSSRLSRETLRDFDERYAWQFFGLPDGEIGDLYYLFERTTPRVDHVMDNYLPLVEEGCKRLQPLVTRNRECFDLFAVLMRVALLRSRAQFALLEVEYFDALWERVPPAMQARIQGDIDGVIQEIDALSQEASAIYAKTIIQADAEELTRVQLGFCKRLLKNL